MGTGYTRNDTLNNIADGNIINASDLDGEFDAVESAFNESTGHTHDGTAAEGAPITVLGPVQDFIASATEIKPKTTNTLDIGTAALQFKDMHLDGTAYLDDIQAVGAVDITGDLDVDNININGNTISSTDTNGNITLAPNGTGEVNLTDNDKLTFGAGSDLQIYHDGSNSYIQDTGTGNLFIQGESAVYIRDNAGAAMAVFNDGGAVQLRYNGVEKLATTNTGVDVTGTVTADGLTVDGNTTLSGVQPLTINTTSNNQIKLQSSGVDYGQAYGASGIDWGFTDDTGTLTRMVIDTSGNVGIGTSSPYNSSKLDVLGSIISTSQTIAAYAANNAGFDYAAGTKIGRFFSTSSDATGGHMTFITGAGGGAERMRIDSSGNLLVGTSVRVDVSKFQIEGAKTFGGGIPQNQLNISDSTAVATGVGGSIAFSGNYSGSNKTTYGSIEGYKDNATGGHYGGSLVFKTRANGADNIERLRIDSSGNVGIGTSPSDILHIKDASSTNVLIDAPTDNASLTLQCGSSDAGAEGAFVQFIQNTTAKWQLGMNTDNTFRLYNYNTSSETLQVASSGEVLVGTTDTSVYNNVTGTGVVIEVNSIQVARSGGPTLLLNRQSSDGEIQRFLKDGSTVGSIGNVGSYLQIDTNLYSGLFLGSGAVFPKNNGSLSDNVNSLGSSSYRWKDLYLSGGAYLGGTGSANLLHYYEEGTWNVTIVNGGLTPTSVTASYTVIGNRVFLSCQLVVPTNSEGLYMALGGLPFATSGDSAGSLAYTTATTSDSIGLLVQGSIIYFYKDGTDYATSEFSNKELRLSAQYRINN